MDELTTLRKKFNTKELELSSLLEITQAINNNLAEDALYKIFNFTLRANLLISNDLVEDKFKVKVGSFCAGGKVGNESSIWNTG